MEKDGTQTIGIEVLTIDISDAGQNKEGRMMVPVKVKLSNYGPEMCIDLFRISSVLYSAEYTDLQHRNWRYSSPRLIGHFIPKAIHVQTNAELQLDIGVPAGNPPLTCNEANEGLHSISELQYHVDAEIWNCNYSRKARLRGMGEASLIPAK
jgi:hypothetical protein